MDKLTMKMAEIKRVVITCGATEVAYDFDPAKGELQVYLGTYISEAPKTDTLQHTRILPGLTQWSITEVYDDGQEEK